MGKIRQLLQEENIYIKGLMFQIPDVNLMKMEIMPIFTHLFDEVFDEYFKKEKLGSFNTIRET